MVNNIMTTTWKTPLTNPTLLSTFSKKHFSLLKQLKVCLYMPSPLNFCSLMEKSNFPHLQAWWSQLYDIIIYIVCTWIPSIYGSNPAEVTLRTIYICYWCFPTYNKGLEHVGIIIMWYLDVWTVIFSKLGL